MKTNWLTLIKEKLEKERVKRNLVILIAIAILGGGVLYRFKGQFIVASVNGQFISRLSLIAELEKQGGKTTLDSLITQALILQEAEKKGITVGNDKLDQEMQQIEANLTSQGQNLEQVLGLQGMTQDQLREQIRIQKIAEEIVGKDIEVTDEEVENYYKENVDSFPKDKDESEIRASIKQQLKQQKINEAIQLWIQSLHDNAKITYFKF